MNYKTIYITLGVVAVVGSLTLGAVGVAAQRGVFANTDIQAALKAGDLGALRNALLANANSEHDARVAKINGLTDADLQNLKGKSEAFAAMKAKQTEYETRLTDILKKDINNKDEFKKVAKEEFDAIKALRDANRPADSTKPARPTVEITDAMLENAYAKAVEQVKAGNAVTLLGGRGFGGGRGGHGGMMGDKLKGLSSTSGELNPETFIN
jgi:hypothetical protein